jgi:Fe-S-cluster containining protein
MVRTLSNEGARRRLPLVVEQGLASTRLAKAALSESFALKVGLDNTTCRQGCAHCCYYPVTISLWEGITVYLGLKADGLWTSELRQRCERHTSLTFGTAPEVWLLASIPCPLLADNLCISHDHRPLRCRMTASSQDPELCRPVHFNSLTFEDNRWEDTEFRAIEARAARDSRDHVRGMDERVPLSTAILMGHRIVEEIIPLEEVPITLMRLLSGGTK